MDNGCFIIIVTFNGMKWLANCLASCKDYSIVVVDNGSTDGTIDFIKSNYPEILILEQNKNLGFGQANNIGISYALNQGAEHILLLNQDAYLVDNVLETMIHFQKRHINYGIISPIHLTADRNHLESRFSDYMRFNKEKQFYSDFVLGNQIREIYDVPFINAAAWLLSKACLEMVGGFDPIFFHYGEDDNYCHRVLYHGFKIGVLPQAYIIHDRIDRGHKKPKQFSDEYYKELIRDFKVYYADINQIDCREPLQEKIAYAKRQFIKASLILKWKDFKGLKKKYHLFKTARDPIVNSYTQNKEKGPHYLDLK